MHCNAALIAPEELYSPIMCTTLKIKQTKLQKAVGGWRNYLILQVTKVGKTINTKVLTRLSRRPDLFHSSISLRRNACVTASILYIPIPY